MAATDHVARGPGTGGRTPGRIGFSQRAGRLDVRLSPYLYISPFFILFGLFGMFPLVYTGWISLHDWDLVRGDQGFVGLENYAEIFGQRNFWIGLRNTLSIFIIACVPQVVMAIALAALLDANLRAKTFWRMGVLLPYVVAPVAVSLIFSRIFGDQYGLANSLLNDLGLGSVGWHSDILSSHIAIATMVNWRWTGYNTLIFLAAMQSVPNELYEASVIDGATRWRQFWSVTIPMIRPTLIFIILTSTIGGLQTFDEPRMFDAAGRGGADRQWMTVTMYIYELGWGPRMDFGGAAATAWILFLIIIMIALVNFAMTRRIATDGGAEPGRDGRRRRTERSRQERRGGVGR